jgi:arginyl-tRNA--protein-N-Asp/Glu arginylyltransferase
MALEFTDYDLFMRYQEAYEEQMKEYESRMKTYNSIRERKEKEERTVNRIFKNYFGERIQPLVSDYLASNRYFLAIEHLGVHFRRDSTNRIS